MPSVVSYCRVSSDEQAHKDLSIPAQRKALLRWIEEREDYELAEEFVDEGESAYAPANKRPGFCRMISFCRKQPVNFILVHKLDRFSRNREESILFKSLLRKHGVIVKSITENFDPETPQGFLYEGMIEVINQFYSMNLATETLKGMRENAERGYLNGGSVPYGYRRERIPDASGREHSKYVLGPEAEVATVREIFRLAVEENHGANAISKILNRQGIPAPRTQHWNHSSVGVILNNTVYIGDSVWNKRSAKKNNTSNLVIINATHEPIIDRALFLKRKELASQRPFNQRSSPRRAVRYLLSRLIRCDHCGGLFIGRRYKYFSKKKKESYDRFRYYCDTRITKGKSICPAPGLNSDWIEGKILELIYNEICSPQRIAVLKELVSKKIEARRSRYGKNPRELDRKLSDLNRRIQNYYQAIGDGVDPKTCKEHIARLEVEKNEVELEAKILQQDDYYRRALELNLVELERFAIAFKEDFYRLPLTAQRNVLLHFVKEIRVFKNKIVRVTLRVPFNGNGVRHLTDELRAPSDEEQTAQSTMEVLLPGPTRANMVHKEEVPNDLPEPLRGAKHTLGTSPPSLVYRKPVRAKRVGFLVSGQGVADLREFRPAATSPVGLSVQKLVQGLEATSDGRLAWRSPCGSFRSLAADPSGGPCRPRESHRRCPTQPQRLASRCRFRGRRPCHRTRPPRAWLARRPGSVPGTIRSKRP